MPDGQSELVQCSGGLGFLVGGSPTRPLDGKFIWRYRNDVVFNGTTPTSMVISRRIQEEYNRWQMAKLFHGNVFGFREPVPHVDSKTTCFGAVVTLCNFSISLIHF
jgi:hypothetical protein